MLKEELELQSWALESAFGGIALGLLVVYKHRALARMAESCFLVLCRGEHRETLSWTHIRLTPAPAAQGESSGHSSAHI